MPPDIVVSSQRHRIGSWVALIAVVGSILLAVVGWSVFQRSGRADKSPTAFGGEATRDEVARLRSDMKLLRRQMMDQRAIGQRALDGVPSPEAADASVEEPHVQRTRESILAAEQARVEDARQRMEVELDSQARDRAFERGVEEQLRAVYQATEFAGTHFESVECRATLCRVRSQHDSREAMMDFTHRAAQHAPFNVEAFYSPGEGETPSSTVYFARAGSSLPHDF